MQTVAIAQQKGGTGKSTTAAAIGAGLAKQGRRVLFIDLDPQANLTYILRARGGATTLDVLTGKTDAATAAQQIDTMPGAAIIPGTGYLAGADATIAGARREYRLTDALGALATVYDVCVVDTPPALGILTANALTAADRVIIPCLPDALSIQALGQIADTIRAIQATSNPRLQIAGVLLTRYTPRQVLSRDTAGILEAAAAKIGTRLLATRIRETVSLREAQAMGQDIFTYAPRSAGAQDYSQLIKEIF